VGAIIDTANFETFGPTDTSKGNIDLLWRKIEEDQEEAYDATFDFR
jgi:hypothetical protein